MNLAGGDKLYYQSEGFSTWLALRAILLPTKSVIHAVALPFKPGKYFTDKVIVEKVSIYREGYAALLQFIAESFYKDSYGKLIELNLGLYGDSQFYKAQGIFYFMNTCNNWTAKGLKSAGRSIDPTFKMTADSIMGYIEKYRSTQSCAFK